MRWISHFLNPIFLVMLVMSQGFNLVWAYDLYENHAHPGYLDSVAGEREQESREVIIVPPVAETRTSLLNEIFTTKMSREFSHEFRYRFGHNEFEQIEYTSNPHIEMGGTTTKLVSTDKYIATQEKFGKYIAKELTEFHVNNYLKGNRNTRQVYTVKEKITNVELKAGKTGYKMKYRYRLSSNRVNLMLVKPGQKLHPEINITPAGSLSPTFHLGYDLTKTVSFRSDYHLDEDIISLQGRKKLTSALSTSLTGQLYNKDLSPETPKQERVLLGLSWSD